MKHREADMIGPIEAGKINGMIGSAHKNICDDKTTQTLINLKKHYQNPFLSFKTYCCLLASSLPMCQLKLMIDL